MASDLSLPEETHTRLIKSKTFAASKVHKYVYESLKFIASGDITPFLQLVLQIYESLFNSCPDNSPEICGICGDLVAAKSWSFGSCGRGHLFRIVSLISCLM